MNLLTNTILIVSNSYPLIHTQQRQPQGTEQTKLRYFIQDKPPNKLLYAHMEIEVVKMVQSNLIVRCPYLSVEPHKFV